jgi:hypothetical protein
MPAPQVLTARAAQAQALQPLKIQPTRGRCSGAVRPSISSSSVRHTPQPQPRGAGRQGPIRSNSKVFVV